MAPFYGWDLTGLRLQRHYVEAAYFLLLIWSNSEGWKTESTLEHLVDLNTGPWIGNPAP